VRHLCGRMPGQDNHAWSFWRQEY